MSRILLAILIGLCCCGPAINSAAQTRKIDSAEVLKQLMALPAPTPRGDTPLGPEVVDTRPPDFYRQDNPPPDNAPVEDIVAYWTRWTSSTRDPSPAHQERLLEACIADPQLLTSFLHFLPQADSTPAKVKNIFDKAQSDKNLDQAWHEKVRRWLLLNSTYFLDELIALAHKVKDSKRDGDVDKEEEIYALANVSWTNAEPLLRGLLASGQPRSRALALTLFYEHAIDENDAGNEERYRRELQAIAADRSQTAYARNVAIESLSLSKWSGRDDWYLSLFQDETLLDLSEGNYSMAPLTNLFSEDPKKWVPILARLVESKDMTVRSAAVSCLVTNIEDEEIRKQALMPLLPWLTNPAWANSPGNQRFRVIQLLEANKIPESVPGLIWVVENDSEDPAYSRGFAAEALAKYEDPRAVPALKKALAKEKDEGWRYRIIKGLLGSGGLSEKEQLEALEEYAAKLASPETRMEVSRYHTPNDEPLSVTLAIGKYLGQSQETPSESMINMVLARAEELKSQNPPLSEALIEIAHQWQGHQVEIDMIRRISNGSADLSTIVEAMLRKDKMQEGLRTELQALAAVAGAAQGVGAVLLNDPALAQGILNSEDRTAKIALLACARLAQMALPVEMIGPFLREKDPLLAQAAEIYLLAEDSREARDILWQHHPNEAFITGWRVKAFMVVSYESLVKMEEELRAELLKENGPTEIVAYVSGYQNQRAILRIYGDKAVFTEYEDPARFRERTVPQTEVGALKDFLTLGNFLERGPIVMSCHHGCPATELLVLTKEKGRRVFNLGGYTEEWHQLHAQFAQIAAGDGAKVHYKLEDEIKGLEVLYAGELSINDVAQQGGELRVAVEREATKEEDDEREASYLVDDEDDEDLATRLMRRRIELSNARFSWRVFANNQLGGVTSAPDFYSTIDETRFITGDENDADWETNYGMKTRVVGSDSIIITRNYDGLWRQFAGSKAVRIGSEDASYSDPIVTRDGKWVVLTKSNAEEEEPNHIVRLNLQTGREFRVNLPPADVVTPIAALPLLAKVLVKRAKAEVVAVGVKTKGPNTPEYFLIDAATGATRPVTGDFTPLLQINDRFLQPTERPDEYWAALPDAQKNHTRIGRYSLKDFSFKPVITVPQLIFDSNAMWVDASQKKVYLVYKGQLLRLPLEIIER